MPWRFPPSGDRSATLRVSVVVQHARRAGGPPGERHERGRARRGHRSGSGAVSRNEEIATPRRSPGAGGLRRPRRPPRRSRRLRDDGGRLPARGARESSAPHPGADRPRAHLPGRERSRPKLGDLSEAAKEQVVAVALAVLVPARRESLAPAALQAWSLARPVIAHGAGEVMRGLVARANGGAACETERRARGRARGPGGEPPLADALGRQGRDYLAAHHSWPVVLEKWETLLARVAAGGAAAA